MTHLISLSFVNMFIAMNQFLMISLLTFLSQVSALKNEKEILLNAEKRASDEVRSLSERVQRLQVWSFFLFLYVVVIGIYI